MFTRQDYMNDICTFRQYYAQFVTPPLVAAVANHFGIENLKEAFKQDSAFNTIDLQRWDWLAAFLLRQKTRDLMKEAGDYLTPAGAVCIVKEAARQAVEQAA